MRFAEQGTRVITTSLLPNGDVLVTFVIDDDRNVTVSVPADTVACFRYLALSDDPEPALRHDRQPSPVR